MHQNLEPPSAVETRGIIWDLNQMDLNQVDFAEIASRVGRLIIGFSTAVFRTPVPSKHRLYRGRKNPSSGKPKRVDQLLAPRPELVSSFQRCNRPGAPMFYCSTLPATVLVELNVAPGDLVYITQWSIELPFILNATFTSHPNSDVVGGNQDVVAVFFQTKFCQPIHETYSNQYKITAAITEALTTGAINDSEGLSEDFRAAASHGFGGISYPSVAHPARPENVAIKPETAVDCLKLNYIEEWVVTKVLSHEVSFNRKDFTADFCGGLIHWSGKPIHWKLCGEGTTYKAVAEADGWIIRDEDGKIVQPG